VIWHTVGHVFGMGCWHQVWTEPVKIKSQHGVFKPENYLDAKLKFEGYEPPPAPKNPLPPDSSVVLGHKEHERCCWCGRERNKPNEE